MPTTHFYCAKCARVLHKDNYHSHMVRSHDGRSDCVLTLTTQQSHHVALGMSPYAVCYTGYEDEDLLAIEAALT